MEYIALAVIIGLAGYFLFRQARKSWRGDSPCSCCSQDCRKTDNPQQSDCECGKEHRD